MTTETKVPFETILLMAKEILKVNTTCSLSGSIALRLQGKKIMREPKDIDIYLPFGHLIQPIDGMREYRHEGENDDYEDNGFERSSYIMNGVQIDFFTPIDADVTPLMRFRLDGIDMIDCTDIIKMKASHAFGDHWTRYKHRNDIIFMMIAN